MFGLGNKKNKLKDAPIIKSPAMLKNITTAIFEIGSKNLSLNEDLDLEELNTMYNDVDINTAIDSLLRGVGARELIFASENKDEKDATLLELQNRFNCIKNKTSFIKELGRACFFGFTLHEIIYNEDFSINKFEAIPRNKIKFDTDKKQWKIEGTEEKFIDDSGKWLMSIYNESIENFKGDTKLRAVYKTYQEIKLIKEKVNAIVEKYGSIIPVFAYKPELSDEDVEDAAKEIKRMYGDNVLAIPLDDGNLKDNFFFITLQDLDINIHETLIKNAEVKIMQNLLGGTLTVSSGEGSGSYALGKVHESEKEKIETEIALFIRDELDKIIDIDAAVWGYEASQYYISIEMTEDKEKVLIVDNLMLDKLNKEADIVFKLDAAGFEIDPEELQVKFGYKTLKRKEVVAQTANTNTSYFSEFSQKNIMDSDTKTLEYLEKLKKKIVPAISDEIKEHMKNVESIEDIEKLDVGLKDYGSTLVLANLWGQYLTMLDRKKAKSIKEFALYTNMDIQDIFNMPFNDAINWLLMREPSLFEEIEKVMAAYRSDFFWIKKSTDLGVTKTIYAELLKNLELGQTFEQFKANLDLDALGLGNEGYYLRQVFDQNIINAQSAGHWVQLQKGIEYGFEYGLYDAITDGRETPLCHELDGKIYRLDSQFWVQFYPPNHYRCRSRVIALAEEDLVNYGYKVDDYTPTVTPQKGFNNNIGERYSKALKSQVDEKEKEVSQLKTKIEAMS